MFIRRACAFCEKSMSVNPNNRGSFLIMFVTTSWRHKCLVNLSKLPLHSTGDSLEGDTKGDEDFAKFFLDEHDSACYNKK